MWHILAELPERGPHAPDATTFTTMLNAMRIQALTGGPKDETPTDAAMRKEALILEGRKFWGAAIARWHSGDLRIDDDLVASMGRLLLCGTRPRDWDDVLSLVQQTMQIQRLMPGLSASERRQSGIPALRAPHTPSNMRHGAAGEDSAHFDNFEPGNEVKADVFSQDSEKAGAENFLEKNDLRYNFHQIYAKPSRNVLSLILEACLKMVAKEPAVKYWDLITDPSGQYAVAPDIDNMHMYLRILRQARASKEALKFITNDFEAAGLTPTRKTYHLALAGCVLDALNPNALNTASKIIDHAERTLKDPGALCFKLYLQVGLQSKPKLSVSRAYQLLSHLDRTTMTIRSLLSFGASPGSERNGDSTPAQKAAFEAETKREREAGIEVLRSMVTLSDRTLDTSKGREEKMGITLEQWKALDLQKRKLSGILFRQDQAVVKRQVAKAGFRRTDYSPVDQKPLARLTQGARH